MKVMSALCLVLLLKFCAVGGGVAAGQRPEILGVRLGASREEAHERLRKLGTLEKEERKQQEVWALSNDPDYSHLIVSFDKEYKALRFVTAVAKEGGRRVRYEEVLDVAKAKKTGTGDSVIYTLEGPAGAGLPGYVVKAIGSHPDYLKYYSVETLDQ